MTNIDKYKEAFVKSLDLSEVMVNSQLAYQGVENWDSVGHMSLVAELQDTFDIMLETDDIIDFSSYYKGIEILRKYDIEF